MVVMQNTTDLKMISSRLEEVAATLQKLASDVESGQKPTETAAALRIDSNYLKNIALKLQSLNDA